jgi:phosphoglycolate phosphatase-like HAD superfamily hydrolase
MDIAAARAAGSPVIAVSYGYGKDHAGGSRDVQPDGCVDELTEIVALCVLQTSGKPHLKLYNTGAA